MTANVCEGPGTTSDFGGWGRLEPAHPFMDVLGRRVEYGGGAELADSWLILGDGDFDVVTVRVTEESRVGAGTVGARFAGLGDV